MKTGVGSLARRAGLKDFAICFSLANLCFLTDWVYFMGPARYYRSGPVSSALVIANLLNTGALAALLWGGITVARRSASPLLMKVAQWIFIALLFVPLNAVRKHFYAHSLSSAGNMELGLIAALFAACAVVAIIRWRRIVVRAGTAGVLILVPFAIYAVAQQFLLMLNPRIRHAAAAQPPSHLAELPVTRPERVVWIVFDEMDEELVFPGRPATLRLPEMDRLRAHSVYATSARAPGAYTQVSMPALLSGSLVSDIEYHNDEELTLTLADRGRTVAWREYPNVFAKARRMGFNGGVSGWYLPYCREIGSLLIRCAWEPVQNFQSLTVAQGISVLLRKALDEVPGARTLPVPYASEIEKDQLSATYLRMRPRALDMAVDLRLGLVLLHWPIPHPPGIYDRTSGHFDSSRHSSYIDNLALADSTLGELRGAMERAGVWDRTTVLVTADHPWRPGIWRHTYDWTSEEGSLADGPRSFVPFLLKLAGQSEQVTYGEGFNTVLSSDLILAVLSGEVRTPTEAIAWLDLHRGGPKNPSPGQPELARHKRGDGD